MIYATGRQTIDETKQTPPKYAFYHHTLLLSMCGLSLVCLQYFSLLQVQPRFGPQRCQCPKGSGAVFITGHTAFLMITNSVKTLTAVVSQ